jgi:flavin-dependent dehydrogenase
MPRHRKGPNTHEARFWVWERYTSLNSCACKSQRPDYDAIVFGIGPAACVFAIQMVRRGSTVLLIAPTFPRAPKPHAETLPPRGEFLLAKLKILAEVLPGQHRSEMVLSCWRTSSVEEKNLAFDPHGRILHLDRCAFDRALLSLAIQFGAETLAHHVVEFRRQSDHWEVHLASGSRKYIVRARNLIDATGRSYYVARKMGAKRVFRDHLAALFCLIQHDGPIAPLLIEPASEGWWYSLGFAQGNMLVALITDPRLTKLSIGRRRSIWDAMLEDAPNTKQRLGLSKYYLGIAGVESGRLDHMSGEGWLAIGDAAMSFDPLSSHGLCSAIEQGIDAGEIFSNPGGETALAAFEISRAELFERYTSQRSNLYKEVRRFANRPFWKARSVW